MNIVSTASDLTQDFKTGYLKLALPLSMFVSQIIGTAMGCVISPCVFWVFYRVFDELRTPKSEHPAPYAILYWNMAILRVEAGFSSLPKNCLLLCYVFFDPAILLNLIKDLMGEQAREADDFGPAVASGLICGNGIWTLPASILALSGIKPPICMKFLSRA
ncbi:hypothetical protein K1719_043693 [Acacia pycnantha]|nr:hypothetical protein K1719_043693 [Acacia pycnantha]